MLKQPYFAAAGTVASASAAAAVAAAAPAHLCDGECVVQVAQRVKLPLLALHSNKELLDALQPAATSTDKPHRQARQAEHVRWARNIICNEA
jgi:hypothetical protein